MTAQVTWSGKVSVFEVKLFLLYLQDLIERIEKETKIGCLTNPHGGNMVDGDHGDN